MDVEMWWERRRENEPTAEYLGRVLEELGARDLANNARKFHYDDYQSPNDVDPDGMNMHRLVHELGRWAAKHKAGRKARRVIQAVMDGEFDGTLAEAEAWMASPEGQATVEAMQRSYYIGEERKN